MSVSLCASLAKRIMKLKGPEALLFSSQEQEAKVKPKERSGL